MKDADFQKLLASVEEAGRIKRGEQEPARKIAMLREKLSPATDEEVWRILDEREPAPSESHVGWTPELRQALEDRVEAARKLTRS